MRRRGALPGRPFRPQDFYLRSSAFLRHRPQKPPVIAPSDEGGTEAAGRRKRVRINTRFLHEDSGGESREAPGSASKTDHESTPPSDSREATLQAPPPVRAIPKSIEEIIASLQSEAQLASDQTIKELIQSVLGQNYDIKMEDISLMGKMYWQKSPQMQAEQGPQISIKETQMNVLEKLPETVSSIFQIEQEDVLEWGTSDAESILFKPQEASEVQSASESSKPLEGAQPIGDSKIAKRISLKVKHYLRWKQSCES
ncbi:PREDICTED: putative uncharacterized protein C14orf25 [Bison bison bison]|uniref:Uncharacterized protein n=1 Tax=Bison bison bison TaxID=43346 RepID=A0A6P3H3G0_BISBB|nr:PREDICTED: putative uncharacterized protein C14orf25 [Bison bison bison]